MFDWLESHNRFFHPSKKNSQTKVTCDIRRFEPVNKTLSKIQKLGIGLTSTTLNN